MDPPACGNVEDAGSIGVGALTLGLGAMAVTTVVCIAKAASADAARRKHYFCSTFICAVAMFAYLAMLSGQGWTASAGCRQFFYVRYLDWLITTPLLVLELGLVAGQDSETITAVVGADVLMIVAGYMGAVSVTTVKWVWFLLSMAMFVLVVFSLARTFRQTVIERKSTEMIQLYNKIAWLTIIMWSFYPVIWMLAEGFGIFSVSFEVVAYAICDIIAKCVFCFVIISANDSLVAPDQTPQWNGGAAPLSGEGV
jgi:bacteriorhodopsin